MERSQICVKRLQYTLLKYIHFRVIMERSPICGEHLQYTLLKDTYLVFSI